VKERPKVAHNTTVKKVAEELGADSAINWADHIIETLEANLKSERETFYGLAKAVVEKSYMAHHIAVAAIQLHETREKQEKTNSG
jgi:hypothetical protein